MMAALRRRDFLFGSGLLFASPLLARAARAAPPRIISLDYGLAQTLIEFGTPPVGLIDTQGWYDWVMEPTLPPGIANVGSNYEINMEMLQLLQPDLIISTPYLEWIRPQLETIAPVKSFPIHALGSSPYPHIVAATLELGQIVGKPQEAQALIDRTERELLAAKAATRRLAEQKLAIMTFLDARNIRVYGPGGIFQDVLDRLDLHNAWTRRTNEWGFSDAGLADLIAIGDSRIFYMDPVPPDVLAGLAGSPLWQAMPFVQRGHAERMASVLMFGALPSVSRFARLLAEVKV